MSDQRYGVGQRDLIEVISLAFDQPHRTDEGQAALENLCAKVDRANGRVDGWARDATETRCPHCRGDRAASAVLGLPHHGEP